MTKKKTVKEILDIDITDFRRLTNQQMRGCVQTLADAANKRIKRFARMGEKSPAVAGVERTGGRFSTKGKNLNQLRHEFMRAKDFLESETGNIKGWRAVKTQTISTIKEEAGFNLDDELWDKVWTAYDQLKESNPWVANRQFRYKILEKISQIASDRRTTADSIARRLTKTDDSQRTELDKLYEDEHGNVGESGTSQYFNTPQE